MMHFLHLLYRYYSPQIITVELRIIDILLNNCY